MASLSLRRLYISSRNWLQPATRLSVNGTRHATAQWRVAPSSHAKFSTADEYEEAMSTGARAPPVPPTPVKLELPLLPEVANDGTTDWSKSYSGLSAKPFSKEIAEVLLAPIDLMDVEIKPGKHFSDVNLNFSLFINFIVRWFMLSS